MGFPEKFLNEDIDGKFQGGGEVTQGGMLKSDVQ